MSPSVCTGQLFVCISIPFVFCARSRPTNKRDRKQKHITKKLAIFFITLPLSTMLMTTRTIQGELRKDSSYGKYISVKITRERMKIVTNICTVLLMYEISV